MLGDDLNGAGLARDVQAGDARVTAGAAWPGYIKDVSRFTRGGRDDAVSVNLLDERSLRRLLMAAGFSIEAVSSYPVPWDREQICCAVTARCGR